MRAPGPHNVRNVGWVGSCVASAALVALAVVTLGPSLREVREVHADLVDPTVATSLAVGTGGNDRNPSRDGRVESLPVVPARRWMQSLPGRIDFPPAIVRDGAGKGDVVVVSTMQGESALVELAAKDGAATSVKLQVPNVMLETTAAGAPKLENGSSDFAAAAPIVLANGTRVVVTTRGNVFGVAPTGNVVFRTKTGGALASATNVGIVPLPNGGFALQRGGELLELDAHGAVVDRTKLDVQSGLAVRESGEIVAVTAFAEVYGWRAGHVPRLLGVFGEKGSTPPRCLGSGQSTGSTGGVAIAGAHGGAGTAGTHERAVCVSEGRVDVLDLATGRSVSVLDKDTSGAKGLPFRTAAAVGPNGEIVTVAAGGALVGLGTGGGDFGPFDVPGAAQFGLVGKDGGITFPSGGLGEIAPLVANDGAVAWGSADGVALERNGIVTKVNVRCSNAWLASAGAKTLVVACNDGKVELLVDNKSP